MAQVNTRITVCDSRDGRFQLKTIEYNTWVTGVRANADSIYIKVNKKRIGSGLTVDVPKNHSLLFNVKCATLIAVDANQFVRILEPDEISVRRRHSSTEDYPFKRHCHHTDR